MVIGQFVAITLSNIAFLRIFLENAERQKLAVANELANTHEFADAMQRNSMELQKLLQEREEIIRQLTMLNKTAGMGALVASFAHELNQPLTANLLHAELLQAKLEEADRDRSTPNLAFLTQVASAVVHDTQRAADIIRKLRNLFRMCKGEYTALKLNEVVQDVLDLVQSKMNQADISCTVEWDPHLRVHGDATQLQQVVLNLLNNAIDALTESECAKPELRLRGKVLGDHLNLEVEDNGPGIAPERAEDVFSLFKTSKSQGMGVGLWLSRSIVEMHGGRLTFQSEPGRRTVFTLRLPLLNETMLG
jgi:signal transduction histidine kinase